MAITKTGNYLEKNAIAKWRGLSSVLSDKALERIGRAGIIKPESEMIAGINKGTDNILKRYGYIEADVAGATPKELQLARDNVYFQMADDLRKGDMIAFRRNKQALKNLEVGNIVNKK